MIFKNTLFLSVLNNTTQKYSESDFGCLLPCWLFFMLCSEFSGVAEGEEGVGREALVEPG